MVQEGCPFVAALCATGDRRRLERAQHAALARRRRDAGAAARGQPRGDSTRRTGSGMVFRGKIDIPIIDWRHYLETVAQHAQLAPVVRGAAADAELRRRRVEPGDLVHRRRAPGRRRRFDQTPHGAPGDGPVDGEHRRRIRSVAWPGTSRPTRSTRASTRTGRCSHAADDVWDGILDGESEGRVHARRSRPFATSRIVAGGPIEGGDLQVRAAVGRRARSRAVCTGRGSRPRPSAPGWSRSSRRGSATTRSRTRAAARVPAPPQVGRGSGRPHQAAARVARIEQCCAFVKRPNSFASAAF